MNEADAVLMEIKSLLNEYASSVVEEFGPIPLIVLIEIGKSLPLTSTPSPQAKVSIESAVLGEKKFLTFEIKPKSTNIN